MLGLPILSPHSSKHPPLPGRTLALGIAITSFCFQIWLTRTLSSLATTVGAQLAEEDGDGEWRRLEALRAVVLLGRFWALMGSVVSFGGIAGILKDHAPLVRLFCLVCFLSLGGELLLLLLGFILLLSSSSASLVSLFCSTISNSDLFSSFLGSSLELCEERWNGLATALVGFIGVTSLVRLYCSVNILSYYTMLNKRSTRRKGGLNINTRLPSYRDADNTSSPSSKKSANGHKIFLLPNPVDVNSLANSSSLNSDVPLLAMTPPSPNATSFPPRPTPSHATPTASISSSEQQYLVYAPVMMTAEQAGQLGATEIVYSRARSRSHTQPITSPLTPTQATQSIASMAGMQMSNVLEEEDDGSKGKRA